MKEMSLEQSIDFNYYIKELARGASSSNIYELESFVKTEILPDEGDYLTCVSEKTEKSEGKIVGYYPLKNITLGKVLDQILSSIQAEYTYYPFREMSIGNDGNRRIPDKALIFNYYATKDENNIINAAYYLTNGYKESYKVPDNITEHMFHPFENVYCYATTEGCGYYVLMDESNKLFFSDAKKLQTDYFQLYLLLLFQYYSLLLYSDKIAKTLPASSNKYKKFSDEIQKTLADITTEINVFLAKSVYSSVSYVQQQNDYYNYVASRLRIRDSIESMKQGLVALEDLEQMLHKEEEKKREKIYKEKEKKRDKRIQFMLALFSFVSFANIIIGLFSAFSVCNAAIVLIILIVVFIFIWKVFFRIKRGD